MNIYINITIIVPLLLLPCAPSIFAVVQQQRKI